jgi:hypothetical protein
MSNDLCYINVASSHYCLKKFINYDNHIFLNFVNVPIIFYTLFPKKYHALFEKFLSAKNNYILKKWNCKKPLPHNANSIDHILCSNFLEHVYETEALEIVKDFYLKLKPGSTLHILLPDLSYHVRAYLSQKQIVGQEHLASDHLNFSTILTSKSPPSLKFRLMEMIGSFGLKHLRMYDEASANTLFESAGFKRILLNDDSPSYGYLANTPDNIHLLYKKPN